MTARGSTRWIVVADDGRYVVHVGTFRSCWRWLERRAERGPLNHRYAVVRRPLTRVMRLGRP